MRYYELIEKCDAEKMQIDAQKKRAKQTMKNAQRAKEQARAADLRLKQKRSQQALSKINSESVHPK